MGRKKKMSTADSEKEQGFKKLSPEEMKKLSKEEFIKYAEKHLAYLEAKIKSKINFLDGDMERFDSKEYIGALERLKSLSEEEKDELMLEAFNLEGCFSEKEKEEYGIYTKEPMLYDPNTRGFSSPEDNIALYKNPYKIYFNKKTKCINFCATDKKIGATWLSAKTIANEFKEITEDNIIENSSELFKYIESKQKSIQAENTRWDKLIEKYENDESKFIKEFLKEKTKKGLIERLKSFFKR